jgi:hypothetical protein
METGKNKKWLAGRIRSRNLSSQCAHAWISASAKQKITKRTHLSLEAKPAGQQLTTIPSQIRSKTNPFCTFKLRHSNLFQPLRRGNTAGEIRNSQPRTERRLSVGFACGVARGLIYARSRLKIRNVGLPITIDQITRHQTKSKSQI